MTDSLNPTEWVTTAEAAELTGYSVQYIRRLINKGRVHAKKWARDWMVDKDALLAYQQAMTQLGSDRYNPWRTGARKRENNGAD
jgi:excisionase family DNA binding protein